MVVFLLVPFLLVAIIKIFLIPAVSKNIDRKHVVITGGSSGIGKSVATLAARKGANVTIIARNQERLSAAQEDIKNACIRNDQVITNISVDVSDKTAIHNELNKLEDTVGPIFMLINCAGMAICGEVESFKEEDVKTLINTNYLGTLYPIQSVVPKMKQRQEGIIVLTASQAALMGIFGLSVYASCKFALRGLAEAICMELKPHNVSVTLALPPDTDTPGLENENKTKPEETKLISGAAGCFHPDVVAEKLLRDALAQKFFSYVGFESYLLTTLSVGMTPFASLLELLVQSILLGPIRLISAYYSTSFEKIIKKCHLEKQKNK